MTPAQAAAALRAIYTEYGFKSTKLAAEVMKLIEWQTENKVCVQPMDGGYWRADGDGIGAEGDTPLDALRKAKEEHGTTD